MHNQGSHIISRCRWNTIFDEKRKAASLQNELSSWSHYHMQRVINQVFDTICPNGHSLKIKSLELNLGEIIYENLFTELPVKLENALRETLRDLLLYPKNGSNVMEIIREDVAQIHVLQSFLQTGRLPWNYHKMYGSVQLMMRVQLAENRLETIEMIRKAATSENVRKRLAWQYDDATMHKIIIGLEPNNHRHIIGFSEEFIKVQEKESIVPATSNMLRKNLWFWILNYLFTDRGTLFNKTAFVQSTLQQMAQHFNISFEALLELIEAAIERMNEFMQVDKEFVAILKTVTKTLHEQSFRKIKTKQQEENFWKKVTYYLQNPSLRKTHSQKDEFNELVVNLARSDVKRFKKIILKTAAFTNNWQAILIDLQIASIESIFHTIAPVSAKTVLKQLDFMVSVKDHRIALTIPEWYTLGLQFCIENQHTSVDEESFVNYVIQELSKKKQRTTVAILEAFLQTSDVLVTKKSAHTTLFQQLRKLHEVAFAEKLKNTTDKAYIKNIISQYIAAIEQQKTNTKTFQSLEKTVLYLLAVAPEISWAILQKAPKTLLITAQIRELSATFGIARLLQKIAPETVGYLQKLQTIWLEAASKNSKIATLLRKQAHAIPETVCYLIWKFGSMNRKELVEKLLDYFSMSKSATAVQQTAVSFTKVIQQSAFKTLGIASRDMHALETKWQQIAKIDLQTQLVEAVTTQQRETVLLLLKNIVQSRKLNTISTENKTKAINYLLPNGNIVYKRLMTSYLEKFSQISHEYTETKITQLLSDCFWQIVVQYEQYRGDAQKFSKLFAEAILVMIPKLERFSEKTTQINLQNATLRVPVKLSVEELFDTIKEHLFGGRSHTRTNATFDDFSIVFVTALETSAAAIQKILAETSIQSAQEQMMRNAVTFSTFISLTASDSTIKNRRYMQAVQAFYSIISQLQTVNISTKIETVFWKRTLAMFRSKNVSESLLEQLITEIFDLLAEISALDQITIIKHIQNNRLEMPSLLRKICIKKHSIYELIPEKSTERLPLENTLQKYATAKKIHLLVECLITQQTVPIWWQTIETASCETLLQTVLRTQPMIVLQYVRTHQLSRTQWNVLLDTISIELLVRTLEKSYPKAQKELRQLLRLYQSFESIHMRGITTKEMLQMIKHKIWNAWQNGRWELLSETTFWNEFLWEICGKKGVNQLEFTQTVTRIKHTLPLSLQIAFEQLKSTQPIKKSSYQKDEIVIVTEKKDFKAAETITLPKEGVPIPNAGLVLLNNYFKMLLERLKFVENDAFISEEIQLSAIHYFQYVVTGLSKTEESSLILNKILCGLLPETPVADGAEITQEEKELMDGLIKAVVGHWSKIGETSVNGFRGNWLVREGILYEDEERWELTVEKRSYDILLNTSPFSFSIIKLPWMKKPLHVTWAY